MPSASTSTISRTKASELATATITETFQHQRPRHASPDFSPHGLGLIVVRAYAEVWSRPLARAPTARRFYGFVKLVLSNS